MLLALFLSVAVPLSGPAHASGAVVSLGGRGAATASLDWTDLSLDVSAASHLRRGAWQDRRVQEQDALDELGPRISALASEIPVTVGFTAGRWLQGPPELAGGLRRGLKGWRVEETRYLAGGGVEMDAVLDLQDWLRPAVLVHAIEDPPRVPTDGPTGILIDARGTGFLPVYAPTVRTPAGTDVIALDRLGRVAAQTLAPVLYVLDPADPRTHGRIGDRPLFARGTHTDEGVLYLDAASSGPMLAHSAADALVAGALVVVVIDPP
jgi:hypothetical protein